MRWKAYQKTQLQKLVISGCPVETLPESIQELKNLREITAYKIALTDESAEQLFNAMPQLRRFTYSDKFLRR